MLLVAFFNQLGKYGFPKKHFIYTQMNKVPTAFRTNLKCTHAQKNY